MPRPVSDRSAALDGTQHGADMSSITFARSAQQIAAIVAVLFGIATVIAGGRVLLGSDPGYVVFRPLLLYNAVMGIAYIAAGITIARNLRHGRNAASVIFVLNLLVLVGILVAYRQGGSVAVDSLRAMSLRTVVWLLLFVMTGWLMRTRNDS